MLLKEHKSLVFRPLSEAQCLFTKDDLALASANKLRSYSYASQDARASICSITWGYSSYKSSPPSADIGVSLQETPKCRPATVLGSTLLPAAYMYMVSESTRKLKGVPDVSVTGNGCLTVMTRHLRLATKNGTI